MAVSAIITVSPIFCNAPPNSVVKALAPTSSTPSPFPLSIPSRRATQPAEKPCAKIVATTTPNTNGTSASASFMPKSSSRSANRLVTAIATTPRGAIQATNSRSRHGMPEKARLAMTVNGRTTNSSRKRKIRNRAWKRSTTSHCSVADRMTKTPEINRTARSSLKCLSAAVDWVWRLPMTTPISVTVMRPVSCLIRSAATKPAITATRTVGALRYSGI